MSDSDEDVFNPLPQRPPRSPRLRARPAPAPPPRRWRPTLFCAVAVAVGALALAYALTFIYFMSKELQMREPALTRAAAVFLSIAYVVLYTMAAAFRFVFGGRVA